VGIAWRDRGSVASSGDPAHDARIVPVQPLTAGTKEDRVVAFLDCKVNHRAVGGEANQRPRAAKNDKRRQNAAPAGSLNDAAQGSRQAA
jgi:hypothetical protein